MATPIANLQHTRIIKDTTILLHPLIIKTTIITKVTIVTDSTTIMVTIRPILRITPMYNQQGHIELDLLSSRIRIRCIEPLPIYQME